MKKILIIGSGGREHAIAWKIAQSKNVQTVFVAPGNAGTQLEPKIQNTPISIDQHQKLLDFAKKQAIDLTIIGPEKPLEQGLVDLFNAENLAIFGPNQKAAQLESSKIFCKQLLEKYRIPTASYQTFNNLEKTYDYLEKQTFPMVIKVDGLAAGKGVIIAENLNEAKKAAHEALIEKKFGNAGQKIIVEQFLQGQEASFMVLVNGHYCIELASSQDHKKRDNNDQGPNTGGMGAYSPAPIIENPNIRKKITQQIIEPTLNALIQEDIKYSGFLYAGLMIDQHQNPHVLEYNCRMGDPETQAILMRLESDFFELIDATMKQAEHKPRWSPQSALTIVMATKGYPENYPKNTKITTLPENKPDQKIFHASTSFNESKTLIATGGRVLNISAVGQTLKEAKQHAYQMIQKIQWEQGFFRTDIGDKGL